MGRRRLTRASHASVLAALVVTTAVVAVFDRVFGFPPLVLFAVPIAVAAALNGPSLVVIAVIATAFVGDFFFVVPIHETTVHAEGRRLLLSFGLAAVIAILTVRHGRHTRGHVQTHNR
jgi:K+-sensing histidine kinase KdpD